METPKEYYYTYYSYEEWGMGYFGSRGCYCLPEEDIKYFGSFSDKNFKPTQKIILKSDYATREEAYADEIILQRYYKVVENPHFANRAYQTSTGFSRKGMVSRNKGQKMSLEQRKKLSNACKGRKLNEETKNKLRKKLKGRILTEEHKRKIANSTRGKSKTITEKRKQSDIQRGLTLKGRFVGDKNPTKRLEVREKISNSCKGRIPWNKGKIFPELSGSNNPKAKRIKFEGVIYGCVKDALEKTGRSKYYIQKYAIYL
jgi:hypothetical protein